MDTVSGSQATSVPQSKTAVTDTGGMLTSMLVSSPAKPVIAPTIPRQQIGAQAKHVPMMRTMKQDETAVLSAVKTADQAQPKHPEVKKGGFFSSFLSHHHDAPKVAPPQAPIPSQQRMQPRVAPPPAPVNRSQAHSQVPQPAPPLRVSPQSQGGAVSRVVVTPAVLPRPPAPPAQIGAQRTVAQQQMPPRPSPGTAVPGQPPTIVTRVTPVPIQQTKPHGEARPLWMPQSPLRPQMPPRPTPVRPPVTALSAHQVVGSLEQQKPLPAAVQQNVGNIGVERAPQGVPLAVTKITSTPENVSQQSLGEKRNVVSPPPVSVRASSSNGPLPNAQVARSSPPPAPVAASQASLSAIQKITTPIGVSREAPLQVVPKTVTNTGLQVQRPVAPPSQQVKQTPISHELVVAKDSHPALTMQAQISHSAAQHIPTKAILQSPTQKSSSPQVSNTPLNGATSQVRPEPLLPPLMMKVPVAAAPVIDKAPTVATSTVSNMIPPAPQVVRAIVPPPPTVTKKSVSNEQAAQSGMVTHGTLPARVTSTPSVVMAEVQIKQPLAEVFPSKEEVIAGAHDALVKSGTIPALVEESSDAEDRALNYVDTRLEDESLFGGKNKGTTQVVWSLIKDAPASSIIDGSLPSEEMSRDAHVHHELHEQAYLMVRDVAKKMSLVPVANESVYTFLLRAASAGPLF